MTGIIDNAHVFAILTVPMCERKGQGATVIGRLTQATPGGKNRALIEPLVISPRCYLPNLGWSVFLFFGKGCGEIRC